MHNMKVPLLFPYKIFLSERILSFKGGYGEIKSCKTGFKIMQIPSSSCIKGCLQRFIYYYAERLIKLSLKDFGIDFPEN